MPTGSGPQAIGNSRRSLSLTKPVVRVREHHRGLRLTLLVDKQVSSLPPSRVRSLAVAMPRQPIT